MGLHPEAAKIAQPAAKLPVQVLPLHSDRSLVQDDQTISNAFVWNAKDWVGSFQYMKVCIEQGAPCDQQLTIKSHGSYTMSLGFLDHHIQ